MMLSSFRFLAFKPQPPHNVPDERFGSRAPERVTAALDKVISFYSFRTVIVSAFNVPILGSGLSYATEPHFEFRAAR